MTEADWDIAREKARWAWEAGLDTLPIGETVARLGATFVGTTYTPHTLELPGPERLVINLRELDCVTFVETVLTLSRLVHGESPEILGDSSAYRARYREILETVRYRDGRLEGYPSRLHYFSEWIADNARKGLVRDVTEELGGLPDAEPIRFMSEHPEAYRQLSDPAALEAVLRTEERLNRSVRHVVPEDRIADAADRIRNGDVIAATSTVEGLDVAHTGLALWRGGRLHLLHAPLVGKSVEISALPLAERIVEIEGQDGIMVARPLPPEA